MKKLFTLMLLNILSLNVLLIASELVHKRIEYSTFKQLSKTASGEFISETIQIPIESPEPFIAIGLKADKLTTKNAHFYIRVSKDKIYWSDWLIVENDNEIETNSKKFFSTLSFFDKGNRFIQFKVTDSNYFSNPTFFFISPGKSDRNLIEASLRRNTLSKNISGNFERPAYVNRKAWGCPQDENVSSRELTNVTHLIIHHSAGHTTASDFAAVVLSYWDYHVNGHGWADIGYNWLVDPNGVLYKGRAWKSPTEENVKGAHNSGKNSNTAGICLIGNYVSNIPEQAGLDKLASISAFLCDKYEIDPLAKSYHEAIGKNNDNITGHGLSGGGTSCPGTQIINRLPLLREMTAKELFDTTAAPTVKVLYPSAEVDSAYLTKKIKIEFSHPMDTISVINNMTITPSIFGNISWKSDQNILYYSALPSFTKRTNYTIKISDSAQSKWGVPLGSDFNFSFVTKSRDNLSLVSSYPEDNAVNVEPNVVIKLTFDGPIDGNSLSAGNITFTYVDSTIGVIVYSNKYSDGKVIFQPINDLDGNTEYRINLKEGIKSTDNYTLGIDKTITFRTKDVVSVKDEKDKIPNDYKLITAYPNPFNPITNLQVNVPTESNVKINIYDIMGNLVKTLINKKMKNGTHNIKFDATNLTSGVYFTQIITNTDSKTIKLVLAK